MFVNTTPENYFVISNPTYFLINGEPLLRYLWLWESNWAFMWHFTATYEAVQTKQNT